MVIWKYSLEGVNQIETFMIPRRAKIRHGDYELGNPSPGTSPVQLSFWIELDPEAKKMQSVDVMMMGTGHPFKQSIMEAWNYVNSFVIRETNEVYHVYCRETPALTA